MTRPSRPLDWMPPRQSEARPTPGAHDGPAVVAFRIVLERVDRLAGICDVRLATEQGDIAVYGLDNARPDRSRRRPKTARLLLGLAETVVLIEEQRPGPCQDTSSEQTRSLPGNVCSVVFAGAVLQVATALRMTRAVTSMSLMSWSKAATRMLSASLSGSPMRTATF